METVKSFNEGFHLGEQKDKLQKKKKIIETGVKPVSFKLSVKNLKKLI